MTSTLTAQLRDECALVGSVTASPLAGRVPAGKVAAVVGGHRTRFMPVYREFHSSPATVTMTVALPLSLEDITAALWIVLCGGTPVEEFWAELDWVHEIVCETVIGEAGRLEEVRLELDELGPRDDGWSDLTALRVLAAHLYGPPATDD